MDKWRFCEQSNAEDVTGGIAEAMGGADVVAAFSAPQPGITGKRCPRSATGNGALVVSFACIEPLDDIPGFSRRLDILKAQIVMEVP